MIPRFDPTRAVVFDLARGKLLDDEGSARLNVPVTLLLRLCEGSSQEAVRDFGRGLGSEMGRRARGRLGDQAESAGVEPWLDHLGGELALMGLGNLSSERWGRALVLVVDGAPVGADELVSAVLEGALHRALGRDVAAIALGAGDGDKLRVLVAHPLVRDRVRGWLDGGMSFGDVLQRLHGGGSA